jgi:hypothetical protein
LSLIRFKSTFVPALALLVAGTLAAAAAHGATHERAPQHLVVRGDATAVDGPCSAGGVCPVALTGGRFRGAPIGGGAYTASLKVTVARAFPNGEGGICAPLNGRIVLGAGTEDRLVVDVAGHSCQDGGGPVASSAFTGVARFELRSGTGRYAHASGRGLATFAEDAAKHHRMTLVGHIRR